MYFFKILLYTYVLIACDKARIGVNFISVTESSSFKESAVDTS